MDRIEVAFDARFKASAELEAAVCQLWFVTPASEMTSFAKRCYFTNSNGVYAWLFVKNDKVWCHECAICCPR